MDRSFILSAVAAGKKVSQVHLRYINPLPRGLGELLGNFKKVIVPEMNNGMLSKVLRSEYLVDAIGVNKTGFDLAKDFKTWMRTVFGAHRDIRH